MDAIANLYVEESAVSWEHCGNDGAQKDTGKNVWQFVK